MEKSRMKELAGLINEASLPHEAFNDRGYNNPMVWFCTERKPKGVGTYYYLHKDGWFRLSSGRPSDGNGLMIRSIKVHKQAMERTFGADGNGGHTAYRAFVQYLPGNFDDWDDDKPKNYEKMWIVLYIRDSLNIGPEDVEGYVRSEMHNWRP